MPAEALVPHAKGRTGENTTIAIVATDATLTKAQAKQFAVMAQDGLARAIYPATPRSTATRCSPPRPAGARSKTLSAS